MKRVQVIISGKVTGVFFRSFVKYHAIRLKLNGFVKNESGKVEAVFEGKEENIKRMIELCKKGPEGSKATDLKINEQHFKNEFKDFEVIH